MNGSELSAWVLNTGGKMSDGIHSFVTAPTLQDILVEQRGGGFAVVNVEFADHVKRRMVVLPSDRQQYEPERWFLPCLMWNGDGDVIELVCLFTNNGGGSAMINCD